MTEGIEQNTKNIIYTGFRNQFIGVNSFLEKLQEN